MARFKADSREQGPKRRRNKKQARRRSRLKLELLEADAADPANPYYHPTSTNLADAEHGPMANLGVELVNIFTRHSKKGQTNASSAGKQFPIDEFQGNSVLVDLSANGPALPASRPRSRTWACRSSPSSSTYQLIDGWLPINELPTAAQLPQLERAARLQVQSLMAGKAINEAGYAMLANLATQNDRPYRHRRDCRRHQHQLQQPGRLCRGRRLGRPAIECQHVQTSAGNAAASGTDEGRGDGPEHLSHRAGSGPCLRHRRGCRPDFAQNILALANAGSNIIVDDLTHPTIPMFQPGLISQADQTGRLAECHLLQRRRQRGRRRLPLELPQRHRHGDRVGLGNLLQLQSQRRHGPHLPITVTAAGADITFQFDQPFNTQQVNKTNMVTSQLNFYVLDPTQAALSPRVPTTILADSRTAAVRHEPPGRFATSSRSSLSKARPRQFEFAQFGDSPST